MKKRILTLALSLALCASLVTPALAAETVVLTGEGVGEQVNQVTLTGVLAQEKVTAEFRHFYGEANDIEEVYEEQFTVYTVAHDFTATAIYDTRSQTIEDGIKLPFYSGYRLSEDGKYVEVGYGEVDSYGVYAPDGKRVPVTQEEFLAMGSLWDTPAVTREEFLSMCDLIKMTSDTFNINVWIRVEGGAAAPTTPTTPAAPTVAPSPCAATLDGKAVSLNAYLFTEDNGGTNYVMLRDVAYLLNGSTAQFEVTWDKDKGIILTTGQAYTAVGGEMQGKGDEAKSYVSNASTITIDGNAVELTAYTIEGNNYFKLRDLGAALGFGVDWDGTNGTVVIDTTAN